jgi:hypothetical protein
MVIVGRMPQRHGHSPLGTAPRRVRPWRPREPPAVTHTPKNIRGSIHCSLSRPVSTDRCERGVGRIEIAIRSFELTHLEPDEYNHTGDRDNWSQRHTLHLTQNRHAFTISSCALASSLSQERRPQGKVVGVRARAGHALTTQYTKYRQGNTKVSCSTNTEVSTLEAQTK